MYCQRLNSQGTREVIYVCDSKKKFKPVERTETVKEPIQIEHYKRKDAADNNDANSPQTRKYRRLSADRLKWTDKHTNALEEFVVQSRENGTFEKPNINQFLRKLIDTHPMFHNLTDTQVYTGYKNLRKSNPSITTADSKMNSTTDCTLGRMIWTEAHSEAMAEHVTNSFSKGLLERPTIMKFLRRLKDVSPLFEHCGDLQLKNGYSKMKRKFEETREWIYGEGQEVQSNDQTSFSEVVKEKCPYFYAFYDVFGEESPFKPPTIAGQKRTTVSVERVKSVGIASLKQEPRVETAEMNCEESHLAINEDEQARGEGSSPKRDSNKTSIDRMNWGDEHTDALAEHVEAANRDGTLEKPSIMQFLRNLAANNELFADCTDNQLKNIYAKMRKTYELTKHWVDGEEGKAAQETAGDKFCNVVTDKCSYFYIFDAVFGNRDEGAWGKAGRKNSEHSDSFISHENSGEERRGMKVWSVQQKRALATYVLVEWKKNKLEKPTIMKFLRRMANENSLFEDFNELQLKNGYSNMKRKYEQTKRWAESGKCEFVDSDPARFRVMAKQRCFYYFVFDHVFANASTFEEIDAIKMQSEDSENDAFEAEVEEQRAEEEIVDKNDPDYEVGEDEDYERTKIKEKQRTTPRNNKRTQRLPAATPLSKRVAKPVVERKKEHEPENPEGSSYVNVTKVLHGKTQLLKCDSCHGLFLTRDLFNTHVREWHTFKCKDCGHVASDKASYAKHMKRHFEPEKQVSVSYMSAGCVAKSNNVVVRKLQSGGLLLSTTEYKKGGNDTNAEEV